MGRQLAALVALVSLSLCRGQAWEDPEFCNDKECPKYQLLEQNQVGFRADHRPGLWRIKPGVLQDFEVREYAATD